MVRDLVGTIADTVTTNGGYIHPDLTVHHRGAALWISLPRPANPHVVIGDGGLDKPHPDAPALLVVPDDLHVPVTDLDWEPHDTLLRYRADAGHLSEAQTVILDAMVNLFNTVDKVRQVGANYPLRALRQDRDLDDLVTRARPARGPQDDEDSERRSESASLLVVRSRLRTGRTEGEEGPVGYFMPMIDMLNHHPYGSRYRREADGDWRIDVHHPTATDQMFVRYNRADSLGNLLHLGYVETDTRFVASVACEIHSEVLGTVRVEGRPARQRRLSAPRLTRSADGLSIDGLALGVQDLDSVRRLLQMPVQVIAPDADADAVVQHLLRDVHAANVSYYRELLDMCTTEVDERGDTRLRTMFAEVSRHQLALLERVGEQMRLETGENPTETAG